jgi:hypothetical protein
MAGGIGDVLAPAPTDEAPEENRLWVRVPPGFLALPIGPGAERTLVDAGEYLRELLPERQRELLPSVIGTMTALLDLLARDGALYAGVGAHTAEDGEWVTSTLVVSAHALNQKRNPRLALRDYVEVMAADGDHGQVEMVGLPDGRSALSVERVAQLPARQLPDEPPQPGVMVGVYQLQLIVPSSDGSRMAVLEFCTPYVAQGPDFRAMMIWFAVTVAFEPPTGSEEGGSTSRAITDVLGGS